MEQTLSRRIAYWWPRVLAYTGWAYGPAMVAIVAVVALGWPKPLLLVGIALSGAGIWAGRRFLKKMAEKDPQALDEIFPTLFTPAVGVFIYSLCSSPAADNMSSGVGTWGDAASVLGWAAMVGLALFYFGRWLLGVRVVFMRDRARLMIQQGPTLMLLPAKLK